MNITIIFTGSVLEAILVDGGGGISEDEVQDVAWTPSEYCNPPKYEYPPTAFLRKSGAAGQAEYPPYPESSPSDSESYH